MFYIWLAGGSWLASQAETGQWVDQAHYSALTTSLKMLQLLLMLPFAAVPAALLFDGSWPSGVRITLGLLAF